MLLTFDTFRKHFNSCVYLYVDGCPIMWVFSWNNQYQTFFLLMNLMCVLYLSGVSQLKRYYSNIFCYCFHPLSCRSDVLANVFEISLLNQIYNRTERLIICLGKNYLPRRLSMYNTLIHQRTNLSKIKNMLEWLSYL
jgi:hypothetical protein